MLGACRRLGGQRPACEAPVPSGAMSLSPWDPPPWTLGAGRCGCGCPSDGPVPGGGGHLPVHPSSPWGYSPDAPHLSQRVPSRPPPEPGNARGFSEVPFRPGSLGPTLCPRAHSVQLRPGLLDAPCTHPPVHLSIHRTPTFHRCPGLRLLLGLPEPNHLFFHMFFRLKKL